MLPAAALAFLLAQPARDSFPHAGLPPQQAAAAMTVPEGFTVSLVAGEPDVRQPIAFCFDHRGRLWVAEAYAYPKRQPEGKGQDRVVVFESDRPDGRFTKRTVVVEGLNLVSGLAHGYGGLWVGAAPHLLFVPLRDDVPGTPEVVLDGWGWQDTHETLNTFVWGPDGWLYGCHGVFTHSKVGKPGTPDAQRTPINAGVWRLHPRTRQFEVFAHGTSNPWGLDFDRHGEAFVEACVIPHCFHLVPGGRYSRQAGAHFNQHTYADIPTVADHRHYLGNTPHAGNEKSDAAGGGHAHAGLMVYQGDAWPAEYRHKLYMGNLHGRRINVDVPRPAGSGYVASHGSDFLKANDAWYRGLNLQSGPDGNVWLIDWYDQQACHNPKSELWDRSNGRVYKVSYRGTEKPAAAAIPQGDVAALASEDVARLVAHPNSWHSRHALQVLGERYGEGRPGMTGADFKARELVRGILTEMLTTHADADVRLRVVWGLHAIAAFDGAARDTAFADASPAVRGWAVRLTGDAARGARDPSPVVRRQAASALQRLPVGERIAALEALLGTAADAGDPNLPLLTWYALEPLADHDPAWFLTMAQAAAYPPVAQFAARRLAANAKPAELERVAAAIAAADAGVQRQLVAGLVQGLQGRTVLPQPPSWTKAVAALREPATQTAAKPASVVFGAPDALAELRATLLDRKADADVRAAAIDMLAPRPVALPTSTLLELLSDGAVRGAALRGLADRDEPAVAGKVIATYGQFSPANRRVALSLLASRPASAAALLAALEGKRIPLGEVPAETVRQLRTSRDPAVSAAAGRVWGVVRDTPAERLKEIAALKTKLLSDKSPADLPLGKAVFSKTCQSCHTLYGQGGQVGPDITGSHRADLDYLLENIVTPSAVVPREYTATLFELKSGRQVTGIIKAETPAAYTVATATEVVTVPKADVEEKQTSDRSMMPDDLLQPLSFSEVRALIAYLRHPKPIP